MAGVVIIPKIHVTLRALWWLSQCDIVFGGIKYPVPVDVNACEHVLRNTHNATVDWPGTLAKTVTPMEYLRYGPGPASIVVPKRSKVPKLWQCSVADMRAMVLSMTTAIDAAKSGPKRSPNSDYYAEPEHGSRVYEWTERDVIIPSCMDCKVLMDQALNNPTPKHGSYPTKVKDGTLMEWREYK